MGSLLQGQRDAGGQMYMRNRYYDPATGQFTQTDPIGIAGGLNTYGFAAGDPIGFADPYGLDADSVPQLKQANQQAKLLIAAQLRSGNPSGQTRLNLQAGLVQPIAEAGMTLETITAITLRLEPIRLGNGKVTLELGAVDVQVPVQNANFSAQITEAEIDLGTGQFKASGNAYYRGVPLLGSVMAGGNLHDNQWFVKYCFFKCWTVASSSQP
jgi:RHS repeat-associated protein